MPTYEYECTACGHVFEKFQSIKDEPLKRCPKCKRKVRRLLGAGAGLIFKGSGFYITDYRKPGYAEKAKSEHSTSSGSSSKSSHTSKSETAGGKSK
jgi:putative FmdB family regulatory protein